MKFKGKDIDGKTVYFNALTGCPDEVVLTSIQKCLGIRDKHGVLIYEGDYLVDDFKEDSTIHKSKLEVVWGNEILSWCIDGSFKKDGSHLEPIATYFGLNNLEVRK